MAKAFVVDTDKARQLGDRLRSVGRSLEGFRAGPQPGGPLGSGVLEQVWSEFERTFAAARQELARSVSSTANGFVALASDAIELDKQQVQEISSLHQER